MAVRAQTEDRDARGVTRRPGRICVRTGEGAASCVCERAEGCAARPGRALALALVWGDALDNSPECVRQCVSWLVHAL